MTHLPPELILIFVPVLIAVEAFFSGSEIALLSADKITLKTQENNGSKRSAQALLLANRPERVLSTTLMMTSFCSIALSSLFAIFLISAAHQHSELLTVAIASPLIVILGELFPKTIFQRHADRVAPWVAPMINSVFWIFYPITHLMSLYTTRISRLVGPIEGLVSGKRRSTREELRSLLSYGRKETEIKSSERKMIKRILDFKDAEAKHALLPMIKIEAIQKTASVREALERFRIHRHSRMPVYDIRVDNIIGVIELKDLAPITDLNQPIRDAITPARYVAETQALRDLVLDMRREDEELVVVVDEYGGAVGILTFEDIVEEIVGEINDEYDSDAQPFRQLDEATWLVQSRMEVSQINEQLRLELPEGDYETLGGFLLQQFGRIPEQGDELYFDTPQGSLKFSIRKANERAIESVLIQKTATSIG